MTQEKLHETEKLRRKELELLELETVANQLMGDDINLQLDLYCFDSDRLGEPIAKYETHKYIEKAIVALENEIRDKAITLVQDDLNGAISDAKQLMKDVEERFAKWRT